MKKETIKIISNCHLCEEKSLHVVGEEGAKVQQCINCGYASSDKYKLNGKNKEYHSDWKNLTEEMKAWSISKNDRLWLPTIMTLPLGMLYPINDKDGEMRWAFASMVDIPKEEQKKYPNDKGGFYEKRIDTDNAKIYDIFVEGMHELNQKMKEQNKPKQSDVKLPKLKKIDGEK